jgi:ABC-type branched-subunit amino acid transport system substrate-binding protein
VVQKSKILLFAGLFVLAVCCLVQTRPACAREPGELVFGMSAAFTGANAEMGIEFYRGIMAYIDHFNAQGGASGWTIRVVPSNDGYNPLPCFKNTVNFVENTDVFALFAYLGTPTTTHILPLLRRFQSRDTLLLFPLSGAQPLRVAPFGRYVYNLRASYFQETAGLVDNLAAVGRRRVAVFYQNDAYGRTGWDGVRRALERQGEKIVSEASYHRGATYEQDFSHEAAAIMEGNPDAVICIGTYASQAGFIRDMRNAGHDIPVAGVSFSDSDKMLELLTLEERRAGRSYTGNLICSQVVPCYEDLTLPGVRFYRELMDKCKNTPEVANSSYSPRRFSYVSFEGFLNAMMLGEIVKRMADDPRRERIPEVMNTIRDFDLGIGERVTFGPDRHQGLNTVYFTTVVNGRLQLIRDWSGWSR